MKSKFKIGDWVKFKTIAKDLTGKIINLNINNEEIVYTITHKDVHYNKREKELKKYSYVHYKFAFGIISFSVFKLEKKWTIRLELSKGWA